MPKERYPFKGFGIGQWLRRTTKGVDVADQTAYKAAELGITPDEMRLINQITGEALHFQSDLEEIWRLLASHSNAARVEKLLQDQAEIMEWSPRGFVQERAKKEELTKIDSELRAMPDLKEIKDLLRARNTFRGEIGKSREIVEKIYPQLSPKWPVEMVSTPQKKKKSK